MSTAEKKLVRKKAVVSTPTLADSLLNNNEPEYFDFRELLLTLYRERYIVAAPALLALAMVVGYLLLTPQSFTATAQILIDVQKPRIISSEALVPGLDTTRYMIGPVIDSQVEIIGSTRIAERVIRKLKLDIDPSFTGEDTITEGESLTKKLQRSVSGANSYLRSLFESSQDKADTADQEAGSGDVPAALAEKLLGQLDVRRKGLTLILLVRYSDEDPDRAARIANTVVETYLSDQKESRVEAARQASELLGERVDELREQVLLGEEALQDYSAENKLVAIGGLTIAEREISETLSQLISARTFAATKAAELQQIKQLASDPDAIVSISQVLSSPLVGDLRRLEAELVRKVSVTANQYGENDNQAVIARAELADVRRQLGQEVQRILQSAQNDFETAEKRVQLLETDLAGLKSEYVIKSRLSIRLSQLNREATATRDLYTAMLSRLKETTLQESLLYPDARVIDRAAVPRFPSSPQKSMALAIALMVGLGLGVTGALLKDQVTDTLRSAAAVEKLLRPMAIVPIPKLPPQFAQSIKSALSDARMPFAQSIFLLYRDLLLAQRSAGSKVVTIVSARDSEGKSTIAQGLARYAALSENSSVLLIDCDLRAGQLTQSLAPKSEKSLLDIVEAGADPAGVFKQIPDTRLVFCPAPQRSKALRPMEILASATFNEFLNKMRDDYDLIILDTSALLENVDAHTLIDAANSSIFVVELNKTTISDVKNCFALFASLNSKASLIALNKT